MTGLLIAVAAVVAVGTIVVFTIWWNGLPPPGGA
jgi:hypothetical protein